MYCINCGKKIPDDAKFCPECGISFQRSSNKVMYSERTMEHKEKPLYKKVWFWILILLASPVLYTILINIIAFIIAFIDGFIKGINGGI